MLDVRTVARVDGTGRVDIEEERCPKPGSNEVLIDVSASAISPGTIASRVRRRRQDPDPDREGTTLGYQAAGDVVDLGDGVDRFGPNDRVACMGAGYAIHASHVVVPVNLCIPLPDGVSYGEGAFNHLAATALHAVRRGEVAIGEYVAVMGLGLVGQFTAQLSQLAGAHVLGIDLVDSRTAIASETGVERTVIGNGDTVGAAAEFTRNRGLDCGFVCFGGDGTAAVETLVEMSCRSPDGHEQSRLVIVGGATMELEFPVPLGNVDVRASSRPGPGYHDAAWERGDEYTTPFVRWTTNRNIEEVLRFVEDGDLDVEGLVTHTVPFADIGSGYDALLAEDEDALGVVVKQ